MNGFKGKKGLGKGGFKGPAQGAPVGGLHLDASGFASTLEWGLAPFQPPKREKKRKDGKGEIPPERQQELLDGVLTFIASDYVSWPLSSELTVKERKYIHQLADEHGLSSQSLGFGSDRYITLLKNTLAEEEPQEFEEEAVVEGVEPDTIQFSGMKIDNESRRLLMPLVDIPDGWLIHSRISLLCKGALSECLYDQRDFVSEIDRVKESLEKLKPGQHISAKVESVGKSETSVSVGLILPKGVMSTQRPPHITIAKAPDAPPMIASRSIDITTWTPIDGPTIKGEVIQHPKGPNYEEPEGEKEINRKRPREEEGGSIPKSKGKGFFTGDKMGGKSPSPLVSPAQTAREMAEALLQEIVEDNNMDEEEFRESNSPVRGMPKGKGSKGAKGSKGGGKKSSTRPKVVLSRRPAPQVAEAASEGEEEDPLIPRAPLSLSALLGLETEADETVEDATMDETSDSHLSLCGGASPQKPAQHALRLTPAPGAKKPLVLKPGLAGRQATKKVKLRPNAARIPAPKAAVAPADENKESSFDAFSEEYEDEDDLDALKEWDEELDEHLRRTSASEEDGDGEFLSEDEEATDASRRWKVKSEDGDVSCSEADEATEHEDIARSDDEEDKSVETAKKAGNVRTTARSFHLVKWKVAVDGLIITSGMTLSQDVAVKILARGEIIEQTAEQTEIDGIIYIPVAHPSSSRYPAPIGFVTLDTSAIGGFLCLEPGPSTTIKGRGKSKRAASSTYSYPDQYWGGKGGKWGKSSWSGAPGKGSSWGVWRNKTWTPEGGTR